MKPGYIFIHNNLFETLFAVSNEEQERGLMHIDPPTPIMTFVYGESKINKFWMANTPAPLDIIFCNNGKVSQICIGEPFSTRTIGDDKYIVIELPLGTAAKSEIKIGHDVGLIKPTITELKKLFSVNR